jgi:D-alanyl-D-alanine carboxypeptidase
VAKVWRWVLSVLALLLVPALAAAQSATAPTAALRTQAEKAPATADRPREALALRLDAARMSPVRASLAILDIRSGRLLYEHAADTRVDVPTATALLTSAAVLALLGPAHRFRTTVLTDGWNGRDTIHGNLYVRTAGGPALDSAMLWKLASELRSKGVKAITGSIVVEERGRDTTRGPPAPLRYYNAAPMPVKPAALGAVLLAHLTRLGIRMETPTVATGIVPASARPLAWQDSAPVSVLAARLFDDPGGFLADRLVSALAAPGMPEDEGRKAVGAWLVEAGISLHDFGGRLGESVRLLGHTYRDFRVSSDFVALLPVVRGPIRARVGLAGTKRSLVGVIPGKTPLAFALLTDGSPEAALALEREILDAALAYVQAIP